MLQVTGEGEGVSFCVTHISGGRVARRRRCEQCKEGKANFATESPRVQQSDNWNEEEPMGIILDDN